MDAQAAARSGDEIAHGVGMAAMIGGALLGALAGAALVVATAATGGVAAVIVAGAVAGGGLSVGSLVKGLATICSLPEPSSGVLMAGSLNVWVNSRPAQRASLDRAAVCSGFPMNHYSLPMPLVAEGSASVFINGCPAARLSSKLICGAHIKSASPNVTWGGPTVRTDAVFDREEWLRTGLQGLGVLALVGGCLVGSFVGAVITAGAFVIGSVVFGALRQWGDSLGPGYADLFEGVAGIALFAGGARAAAKAKMPAVAEGEGGGAKGGIAVAEEAGNSAGKAPSGFASAEEFGKFGSDIQNGLTRAGYSDVQPILQGSAVTGKSYSTGVAFDVGRVSDFDVALASPSLMQKAQELGIGLRSGGTRTGPLTAENLRQLGLSDMAQQMTKKYGREVNFMIYNSAETAAARAPSIPVPKR